MKTIFKNIFTGIVVVIIAAAIIVGLIAAIPVLLVIGGTVIQIGGWVILFGIVIILPIWGIGKLRNTIKNRQKPVKLSEEESEAKLAKAKRNLRAAEERYTGVKAAEEGETIDLTDEADTEEAYEATIKAEYEEKYKATIKAKYKQEYNDKLAKINLKKAKKEMFNRKIGNLKSAIAELVK